MNTKHKTNNIEVPRIGNNHHKPSIKQKRWSKKQEIKQQHVNQTHTYIEHTTKEQTNNNANNTPVLYTHSYIYINQKQTKHLQT